MSIKCAQTQVTAFKHIVLKACKCPGGKITEEIIKNELRLLVLVSTLASKTEPFLTPTARMFFFAIFALLA